MKTLRLQLRFLVPLILTLAGAALIAVPLMDQLTLRTLRPVAIISDRQRKDVAARLPFAPAFIVGNHGAETDAPPPAALARRPPPGVRLFGGHRVLNAAPADVGDKADALDRLRSAAGCCSALFVGDDVNDEPVFERGRPDWLTVRIDPDEASPTRARYRLRDTEEIPALLDCLLDALGGAGGRA